MALLGATFQIGRSALAAYQSAISVVGQNVANVGNAHYARQTARLSSIEGGPTLGGPAPGGGVLLSGLQRHIDEALEARLRTSLGARAAAEVNHQALNEIESLYNELTEYDLSTELIDFFNSFDELQNDPQALPPRNLVVAAADALSKTLHRQRSSLLNQAETINDRIALETEHANKLTQEIAELNGLIVIQEARGPGFSSPLRDQRDAVLRELAEYVDIQTREQANGTVNVYINSEPLVEFNRSRGLVAETVLEDGLAQASIRFGDNHGTVIIRDGRLAADLQARDAHIVEQVQRLDTLARGLIYEVNRIQSTGRGLEAYTQLTSAFAAGDVHAGLDSDAAGLAFPVQNGSFVVHVRDQNTGQEITRLIEVDLDGIDNPNIAGEEDISLSALAAALNGVPGLSASVTADRRLQLTADPNQEMWFSEDTSGALAALGVGTLLVGNDAASIGVDPAVRANPKLIASSLSGALNDGDNAGRFSALARAGSDVLGGLSVPDFHAGMVADVAVATAAAARNFEASDAVYTSLMAQREAISGVSLDEEAINLTKFERAFQGATRYIGVLDTLATEVLALVR